MESPSPSTSAHRKNTANLQKSHYQQTVCLADWWLVRAENEVQGRRLAVAGLTDRTGKQAVRVFTSAPILKTYDEFTMETTDGICVILNGFINKTRTLENGFSSDVFNYFLFGFPPHWKEYGENFVVEEPPSKDILRDKHLEQLAQQLGTMGKDGAQQNVNSCEKDFEPQEKIKAKDRRKSKRTKALGVALPQRCSFSGLQKESYNGGTSDENCTSPVKCLENEVKSSSMELQEKIKHEGIREIKTRSKTQKARNKATESPCTPAASTQSHNAPEALNSTTGPNSTPVSKVGFSKATESPCTPVASTKSHNAPKALNSATGPNSAPVSKKSPKNKKEASLQSHSFNRSRSGRLLMPTLEYWRNQRAIYDADRTITGFEEGMDP